MRFTVADSVDAYPTRVAEHIEASRWFLIDWVGWRAFHWDLEADSLGAGSGNGILEGAMRFDGIEFRYVPGTSRPSMQVYVDQLEMVQREPTGVDGALSATPESFVLSPAYPNPFNPTTTIGYAVGVVGRQSPVVSNVRLAVYDLLGREVAVLVDEQKAPGSYQAQWDAAGFSSGVYVMRLMVASASGNPQFVASQKIILMK